jgi:hypothetical protein
MPPKIIAPSLPFPTGKASSHLAAGALNQILADGSRGGSSRAKVVDANVDIRAA